MSKIEYKSYKPTAAVLTLINQSNAIIEEYHAKGFDLTLRQLYYQLVSRDIIPNNVKSYDRLGRIINNARLGGLVDWEAIIDRTRNLRSNSHWETPAEIIRSARYSYYLDRWVDQEDYVEVWIEKDALVGVIAGVCNRLDVPFFSNRGYVSQSSMWRAANRFREKDDEGRVCTILHLGDHDPSGIDMTRDISERLNDDFGVDVHVKRIALTQSQIATYNPPPNPAKLTDTRAKGYIAKYGSSSWELDALQPEVLDKLISDEVGKLYDESKLEAIEHEELKGKELLSYTADNWKQITKDFEKQNPEWRD